MPYRLEENMDVYGSNGEKVGDVGKVVVGGETREPRFFVIEKGLLFKDDYLIPREAVTNVDDKGVHIKLTKDQVERLPKYEGRPPTPEEARRAYENLGGRRTGEGYHFENVPFTGATETTGTRGTEGTPYVITTEEYLILTPDERQQRGFRNEWEYESRGPGGGTRDRI